MKLDEIETFDDAKEYEVTYTYDTTINYKNIFIELLDACKNYSSYKRVIEGYLYSTLMLTRSYQEDKDVVRENWMEMQQDYLVWLTRNWDALKVSEDIPEGSKAKIQKEVDRIRKVLSIEAENRSHIS